MAGNKFATMLHKHTNKITLILVYAILEWILIILILLNSLFSYLISKFANYFGLKPPCTWCSRLDHILEPHKPKNSYRDSICEAHASEISNLGYCRNHRKLAESKDMCPDCSSSWPNGGELSKKFDLFPWENEIGLNLKCSCCDVSFDNKIYLPNVVISPSWEVLDCTQKGNLIDEAKIDDGTDDLDRIGSGFECKDEENSGIQMISDDNGGFKSKEMDANEGDNSNNSNTFAEIENPNVFVEDPCCDETMVCRKDESIEVLPQHIEFFVDHIDYRLIPVELIDSTIADELIQCRLREEKDRGTCDDHEESILDYEIQFEAPLESTLEREALIFSHETKEDDKFEMIESIEVDEIENQNVNCGGELDLVREAYEEVSISKEKDSNVSSACEVLQESTDTKFLENDDHACEEVSQESTTTKVLENDENGDKQAGGEPIECKTMSVTLELNEVEEERVPGTPTSIEEGMHNLNKKLLLLEKRESSTGESLDGSVTSEFEMGDGILTVDRLKSALKSERRALNALYTELEEERSASAVAANQTMAMITRLQEEKAAMQMEALQYQRMMEEQSEYDQEALQLLNELMVKREKEKQEVEKELEVYRKKLVEYETKEKMMILRRRSRGSSTSCSNAEESDGVSVDLNHEGKEEENTGNHNTPVDEVLNLEESLASFEEERLSILEQLKVLEEKLFTLGDEEEHYFEDMKPIEDFYAENGKEFDENFDFCCENGNVNGNGNENGNGVHHEERKRLVCKPKKLLPLFDAVEMETETETEDGLSNGIAHGFDSIVSKNSSTTTFELNNKRVAIEEEVEHVYERLHALEADREFLKHCMSSLKKGDKGMDLLQEILQHLRDLRNVELRVKNMSDGALV